MSANDRGDKILISMLGHFEKEGRTKEECSLTRQEIFEIVKKMYFIGNEQYQVNDENFSDGFKYCIANEYIKKTKDNLKFCMTKEGFKRCKSLPRNQFEGTIF